VALFGNYGPRRLARQVNQILTPWQNDGGRTMTKWILLCQFCFYRFIVLPISFCQFFAPEYLLLQHLCLRNDSSTDNIVTV